MSKTLYKKVEVTYTQVFDFSESLAEYEKESGEVVEDIEEWAKGQLDDYDFNKRAHEVMQVTTDSKPTIDTYVSAEDGTTVVHIDTSELPENSNGPIMRVYINDDIDNPVYENK